MQAALANDLPWSPSMVFSVERTSPNHNLRDIVDVTAMGKEVKYSYYLHFFVSFGSTDFLDANKAVVSACRRHLRMTYRGLPQWCSPSNALRQTTTFEISSTSPQWGRKSNIVTTSIFLYTRPIYQNYNLQRATNTNQGKAKLMGLATKDINIPCMHAEVRRLVCMALH